VNARSPVRREIALSGAFGAAALLMPVLFHLLHLGSVFMPMYIPLVALAFFVRPAVAATTAIIVPLVSGAVTGMPPFYPPIALMMALELAVMATLISAITRRWPRANEWVVLIPVLLLGRALFVGMAYGIALFLELPAAFIAGVSFVSGWPGLILMAAVIPPFARAARAHRKTDRAHSGFQ
jgi:hypothetical protein